MSEHAPIQRGKFLFRRGCLGVGLAALLTIGCDRSLTIYEIVIDGGAAGESAAAGANGGSAGEGATSIAGSASSGGNSAGGFAGDAARAGDGNTSGVGGELAGASGAVGMGGSGTVGGTAGVAAAAGSDAGGAGSAGLACGTLIADVPADCHATMACTGTLLVDQNNVPMPANPCLEGTCNAAGIPSTASAPAGATCSAPGGGIVCDGAGKCVPCVHTSDCPTGRVCSTLNQCVPGSCSDVDCGGICPPCVTGKKCLADADCITFACDAVSLTCVTPQCQDHRQDGLETDADCGGGSCPSCTLGKSCVVDTDCTSLACDAVKLICISNSCADHRQDNTEADVDCGGLICNNCLVGQKCTSSGDCQPGHVCNTKKVCQ